MTHSRKCHFISTRVGALHFLIVFSLVALSCSAVTNILNNPASNSPGTGPSGIGPSGISGPTKPVGFVNHGSFNAVVMPWTFVPLGDSTPATAPTVSTVSTVPTSPGLWPNSSRFLSLPLGTYTWCFEWDEGDLDDDGYINYFHFFDTRPVTVDENAPDEPDLAIQVDFSTPPGGTEEILSGQCGPENSAGSGTLDVRLLPGNAASFGTPPLVIAYANTQEEPSPAGVTVSDTCGSECWRYHGWVALLQSGQSLEAASSNPTTTVGVQLWGDTNDGWARVLVDDQELWTGNTYGTETDPFIQYLQISGLPERPHTVRVEHMGKNDVTVFFFGFGMASP